MPSKENSAILGMLLRYGRTRMPAGMMSSVETSSAALSKTGVSSTSGNGSSMGNEAIYGPFSKFTCLDSTSGSGATNNARLMTGWSGSAILEYDMPSVRGSVILLDQIMVDVLDAYLGTDPVQHHGFQFQHHQCAGGILSERLIDRDTDFLSRRHRAAREMRLDQLAREIHIHGLAW